MLVTTTVLLVVGSLHRFALSEEDTVGNLGRKLQQARSAPLTTIADFLLPFFQPRTYPLQVRVQHACIHGDSDAAAHSLTRPRLVVLARGSIQLV